MRVLAHARASSSSSAPAPALAPIDRRPLAALKRRNVAGDDIFTVDGVLTARECADIIRCIESNNAFAPSTSRGPAFGEAWRRNGRFQTDDDAFAKALWRSSGVGQFFKGGLDDASGLNPNIRVYRYVTGEHFGPHIDERVMAFGRWSAYTALFYLSDVEDGGRTIFYDAKGRPEHFVEPRVGRALFFRHGVHCCEHEGEQVRRGVKYVLRSDVLF